MTTTMKMMKQPEFRSLLHSLKGTASERLGRACSVDFAINRRAEYQEAINHYQEDGVVAFILEGMDCDCTQYKRVSHMKVPKSIFVFLIEEEKRVEWLDGPESSYFGKPSQYPKMHLQSDRALAAYEDGHMHSVTWASEDEMVRIDNR